MEKMFILPEREAMILASGYDVKLRAKIVDYFFAPVKPLSFEETMRNALVM